MEQLIRDRRFDPEEKTLVDEMLDRVSAAGIFPAEMKVSNIMIGSTRSDPRRSAYIVDGGNLRPIEKGMSNAEIRDALRDLPVMVGFTPGVDRQPAEPILEPLDIVLRKGVVRSRAKTFLQRLGSAILYSEPVS